MNSSGCAGSSMHLHVGLGSAARAEAELLELDLDTSSIADREVVQRAFERRLDVAATGAPSASNVSGFSMRPCTTSLVARALGERGDASTAGS